MKNIFSAKLNGCVVFIILALISFCGLIFLFTQAYNDEVVETSNQNEYAVCMSQSELIEDVTQKQVAQKECSDKYLP